jgi:GntR family transcriptional regulator
MLIVVDPHSGVPVYRQVMDQIKFHVASGLLKPGDELPSTRALSSELGVNPMTISKAYSYLEREDVVDRRPGRPLVVKTAPVGDTRERKLDQLRQSLAGTVTMVRQLGIDPTEAAEIFRAMIENAGDDDGAGESGAAKDDGGRP